MAGVNLIFQVEEYNIPIKLVETTKEKEGIKHYKYVCEKCHAESKDMSNFCNICKDKTHMTKLWLDGEPEPVGSRDMWDIQRVGAIEARLRLGEFSDSKYVELAETKTKLKASQIAKMKAGSNKTLQDLIQDMLVTKTVFRGNVVLKGKINEIYFVPQIIKNGSDVFVTIMAQITDGNREAVAPKVAMKIEQPKEVQTE